MEKLYVDKKPECCRKCDYLFYGGHYNDTPICRVFGKPYRVDCETKEVAATDCPLVDMSEILERDIKDYYDLSPEFLRDLCKLKDRSFAMERNKVREARSVIGDIAKEIGMDDSGFYLYGGTALIEKIKQFFASGGDKVKLKKRIDELENEISVLRKYFK